MFFVSNKVQPVLWLRLFSFLSLSLYMDVSRSTRDLYCTFCHIDSLIQHHFPPKTSTKLTHTLLSKKKKTHTHTHVYINNDTIATLYNTLNSKLHDIHSFTTLLFSFYFKMSKQRHISYVIIFLLLLLLSNLTQTALCHTKGIRPRNSAGKQLSKNVTQTQFSEQQFMKWVKFVGSLKHSIFRSAKNKLFPSYTLSVSKNPAAGDFTSIQDAVDSLPFINLVRVVIKVHAGVYT